MQRNFRAFTLIELIFVIIVLGILSAVFIPRFNDTRIQEAADQLLSHIRYTQHLALIDNKFKNDDANWFKEDWQIRFASSTNGICYQIFSDEDHGGSADLSEAAVNPYDNKALTYTGNCVKGTNTSPSVLIGDKYGIDQISVCGQQTPKTIHFDNLGRPYFGALNGVTSLNGYYNQLIRTPCDINFTGSGGHFTIRIEPETGYAHITSIDY
ncbi:pilus assembly FimT family protein [Hydrogenimonas sp.]